MGKINHRRLKTWKIRVKLPPNKVFVPSTIYNKHRERAELKKKLRDYIGMV